MAGEDFYRVLTDAINDLAEHGFDTAERVARWQEALRRAAEATLTPPHVMAERVHRAMRDVYRRMVDHHGLLRYHQGIERWTIEKLKPELRRELDKRILASADLIRLNRQQSIAQTLRRFSGWATSIPAGGTDAVGRVKLKDEVRKPLARLPFEERRVAVDQGHKLLNSLNTIVAVDQGAIAGVWRSHWRQANYDYREPHKERDGHVYLVRDNWAKNQGLVKPGPDGYADEITQPGEEVFCRCWWQWLYSLRSLPDDMLTAKGRETLEATRVT